MWTFRSWYLDRKLGIEDYIRIQTEFILGLSIGKKKGSH
jgi:TetR/AcrR family transcriptional regulator, cholesterol catabolism regulator